MVVSIIRKNLWKPFYNDGSNSCNLTERHVTKDVSVNGVVTKVSTLSIVDMSKVAPLPTAAEYDLETQLKAGVKPQQINVHGILGTTFDVDFAVDTLRTYVVNKKYESSKAAESFKSAESVNNEINV